MSDLGDGRYTMTICGKCIVASYGDECPLCSASAKVAELENRCRDLASGLVDRAWPAAVRALEAETRVAELEAENADLCSEIDGLQSRLAYLESPEADDDRSVKLRAKVAELEADAQYVPAMVERLGLCGAEIGDLKRKVAELEALAKAQAELLVCYRLGKRPPERVLNAIAKHRAAVRGSDGNDLKPSLPENEKSPKSKT